MMKTILSLKELYPETEMYKINLTNIQTNISKSVTVKLLLYQFEPFLVVIIFFISILVIGRVSFYFFKSGRLHLIVTLTALITSLASVWEILTLLLAYTTSVAPTREIL